MPFFEKKEAEKSYTLDRRDMSKLQSEIKRIF